MVKKFLILTIIMACFVTINVIGSTASIEINAFVDDNGIVHISGVLSPNMSQKATIVVIKSTEPSYTLADITKDNILDKVYAVEECFSDENGAYTTSFPLKVGAIGGFYQAIVGDIFISNPQISSNVSFYYPTAEEKNTLIGDVNSASIDTIESIILNYNTKKPLLNFKLDAEYNTLKSEIHKEMLALRDLCVEKKFKSIAEIKDSYYKALVLSKINVSIKSDLQSIFADYQTLLGLDKKSDYISVADDVDTIFYDMKLKSTNVKFDSYFNMKTALYQSIALSMINKTTDKNIMTTLITAYNDDLKLDLDTNYPRLDKMEVNKVLISKNFMRISEVQEAFNRKISEMISEKPIGGGSTSDSGSTGKVSNSVSVSGNMNIPIVNIPEKEIFPFSDMEDVAWAKNAIKWMFDSGVAVGDGGGRFSPNESVTREQFIKMLVGGFGLLDEDAVCGFSDVKKEDWYYKYIATASKLKITSGIDEKHFGIGNYITREEMATFVFRTANIMGKKFSAVATNTSLFVDKNDISAYALDAVTTMQKANIINGTEENKFSPKEKSTRAQAAKLIYEVWRLAND